MSKMSDVHIEQCSNEALGVDLTSPEYEDCDPPDCGKFYHDPCPGCCLTNYAPCCADMEE